MKRARAYHALGAGVIAVSFGAIFTRLADAPAPMVAALRMIVSSLVLLPFALGSSRTRREIARLSRRDLALLASSGFFLALHFILWISSLSYTGVTSSVVFVTTNPLWVALFTIVFLKRSIARVFWTGLGCAILGGVIIGGADALAGGYRWAGDALALGGAIAIAGYFLVGSRLRKRVSIIAYVFPVYSVAAVLLVLAARLSGTRLVGYPWESYLYCCCMAIVCQVLGHTVFNWALRHFAPTVVTIAAIGEPVGASILALVILHEAPAPTDMLGGILICAGIFIVLYFSPESSDGRELEASGS